jgi:hypothetical protein
MADPKKPDPKTPKADEPYQTAHGPIPAENWGNDLRSRDDSEIDTSPGSVYDNLYGPNSGFGKKKK